MDFRHHSTDHSPPHVAPDDARHWAVDDLIDFEYYLDADESELREHPSARKALAERDRSLYLEKIAPLVADHAPHTPAHRRISLRGWLAARRNAEEAHMRGILPGAAFGSAQRLVTLLLAALGFLAGVGVASALLSYDGTRPVSVSWYLFLLVIVQFALVISVVTAWVVRKTRSRGGAAPPGVLMHVIRPLVTKATRWLQGQRIGHAATEIQDQARARQGLLKSQYALYGPVSYLPLLIPAQVFGVAFNVGIILTTVLLEWFTDLAFGWGSTLDVHPQTIYDMTRLIALPWGWLLGEGVGYPSLEEIAGSRIILEHWATATPTVKPDPAHLRSWGSFLVLAVITYGLLPRLLLWGGSVLAQAFILARLPFTHSRTQALYARMLSPRIETATNGGRQGAEMPIPAPSLPRKDRPAVTDGSKEPTPPAVARPWRNALVQRVETVVETPTPRTEETPAERMDREAEVAATQPEVIERPEQTQDSKAARTELPRSEGYEQESVTPEAEAPSSRSPAAIEPVEPPVETPFVVAPPAEVAEPGSVPPQTEPSKAKKEPAVERHPAARDNEPVLDRSPIEPYARETPPTEVVQPVAPSPESPEAEGRAAESEPTESGITAPSERTAPKVDASGAKPSGPSSGRVLEKSPAPKAPKATPAAKQPPPRMVPPAPATAPATAPKTAAPTARTEAAPAPAPASTPTPAAVAPVVKPSAPATLPPVGAGRGVRFAPDACLLLLHVDIDDILEDDDRPRLAQLLMEHTGWRIAATATFGAGTHMTEEAVALLENGDWKAPPPRVAVIEDGSQPPITESLRFLRELRAAAGTQAQIILALVGDPTDEDRLPPMRPFDYTDWQRKIDQMADPYLRLEMLAQSEEDGDV